MEFQAPIVVGHDGSAFADRALHWACQLATRADLPVRVVRAWTMRTAPRPASETIGFVPPTSDYEAAVLTELENDTAETLAQFEGLEVEITAVRGQPATALLTAAEGANLLVVGPRGIGGFKGLMLGSVSDHLVSHANCPVVVVRTDEDPAQAEPADD